MAMADSVQAIAIRPEQNSPELSHQRNIAKVLYRPLDPWQTRLIRLQPAEADHALILELFPVDLILAEGVFTMARERVDYEALSYCWGENKPVSSCVCNGLDYPITDNLKIALKRLRHSIKPRLLWIDALCIHQHDPIEKSYQVERMLEIFSKASNVIIWLGEATEELRRLLKSSKVLDGHHAREEYVTSSARSRYISLSDRDKILLMQQLCSSPWIQRTWVRQELFAARSLTVQYESWTMSFDTFTTFAALQDSDESVDLMRYIYCPNYGGRRVDPYSSHIENIRVLQATFRHATKVPDAKAASSDTLKDSTGLLDLLRGGQGFLASDERDHIYSLIGMASRQASADTFARRTEAQFPVRYDLGFAEISSALTMFIIMENNNLDILRLCAHQLTKRHALIWPHVDWKGFKIAEKGWTKHYSTLQDLNPTFSRYLDTAARPQSQSVRSLLFLKGWTLGSLRFIGLPISDQHKKKKITLSFRHGNSRLNDFSSYEHHINEDNEKLTSVFEILSADDLHGRDERERSSSGAVSRRIVEGLPYDVRYATRAVGIESGHLSPVIESLGINGEWGRCWYLPPRAENGDLVVHLEPSQDFFVVRRSVQEREHPHHGGELVFELVGVASPREFLIPSVRMYERVFRADFIRADFDNIVKEWQRKSPKVVEAQVFGIL